MRLASISASVTVADSLLPAPLRRCAGAVLVTAAGLSCAQAAPAPSAAPVTLCFESQDVLPWRTQANSGLNFSLLAMVEQRLGIKFEYRSMPWKRCLASLQANLVDGVFSVSYTAERRALGVYPGLTAGSALPDMSKRMHMDSYVVLRKKGSQVEWDGKAFYHLHGPVGFQLGYSVGEVLRALQLDVDEGTLRATDVARKLIAGRIAVAAIGGSDAASVMRSPLGAQLEQLPVPIVEKSYFLVLSHQMLATRPELSQRIWHAVEQARNSAAYKKIEQAHSAR